MARTEATLLASFFSTQAQRMGTAPAELAQTYAMRVQRQTATGAQVLEQGGGLDEMRNSWAAAGIRSVLSERNGVINLSQFVVPETDRGAGKGTAAMQALVDYADGTGQAIALSPSTDFGASSRARLVQFYKRFGFVENKGKDRAFTISEAMYRPGAQVLEQSAASKLDDQAHAARVLQGEPVAVLQGDEAPSKGGMKALRDWAAALFASAPVNGRAVNPRLGDVALNLRAVRDSLGHGFNRYKAAAFAAVPAVLEKGAVIAQGVKDGIQGYYVSAPVQIGGVDDVVTVLVHRDEKTQRMYLHSVATKENLLQTQVSSSSAPTTSAADDSGPLSAGDVRRLLQKLLTLNLSEAAPGAAPNADAALDQSARGQIAMGRDITQQPSVITLLPDADLSTFIHELGHFFLEVQGDMAGRLDGQARQGASLTDGEQQVLADMRATLAWLGLQDTQEPLRVRAGHPASGSRVTCRRFMAKPSACPAASHRPADDSEGWILRCVQLLVRVTAPGIKSGIAKLKIDVRGYGRFICTTAGNSVATNRCRLMPWPAVGRR